jgi:SEC-C motif-containing protein
MPATVPCPCGGANFATCCGPFLAGEAIPQSAEALMRSRYTAYCRRDEDYLRATWHPSTVPPDAILTTDEKLQWLELQVKSSLRLRQRKVKGEAPVDSSPDADTVEFIARYRLNGRGHRLHEVSRFVREQHDGVARWFYLDGSYPGDPVDSQHRQAG